MKGAELRMIRSGLQLTQAQLADKIGVTANTLARWERDEVTITKPMARLIRQREAAMRGAMTLTLECYVTGAPVPTRREVGSRIRAWAQRQNLEGHLEVMVEWGRKRWNVTHAEVFPKTDEARSVIEEIESLLNESR